MWPKDAHLISQCNEEAKGGSTVFYCEKQEAECRVKVVLPL